MHKVAEKRRRFGYRRIGVMLERKGMVMNEKKLYRIYPVGPPQTRPQAGTWQPHADARPAEAEPALVAGLPVRHVQGMRQVPHLGRQR